MFGLISKDSKNAIDMLTADHDKVKELFDQFEEAENARTKRKIVKEALQELNVHATLEEEIFYPAVRNEIEDEEDIMNEADEEHHVAKVLIAELENMKGTEDHYEAKFTVLGECVRHHIKEEEGEMFPKAKDTDIDFDALGERMFRRKQQLMRSGTPVVAEARMVAKSRGQGDSPARAAKRRVKAPKKVA
jgi:hemerythrin superfamily protein